MNWLSKLWRSNNDLLVNKLQCEKLIKLLYLIQIEDDTAAVSASDEINRTIQPQWIAKCHELPSQSNKVMIASYNSK